MIDFKHCNKYKKKTKKKKYCLVPNSLGVQDQCTIYTGRDRVKQEFRNK